MPQGRIKKMSRKQCGECHKVLKLTEFRRHPRTRDGYVNICASCMSARPKTLPQPAASVDAKAGTQPSRARLRRARARRHMYERLSLRGYDGRPHANPLPETTVAGRNTPGMTEPCALVGLSYARDESRI